MLQRNSSRNRTTHRITDPCLGEHNALLNALENFKRAWRADDAFVRLRSNPEKQPLQLTEEAWATPNHPHGTWMVSSIIAGA
jgi:hypothetical protein